MKIFLSYRFTGEDPEELKYIITNIGNSLAKAGHECFCSFWNSGFFVENKYSNKQILDFALKELDTADCVLTFIKSDQKSEGMLLEAGYAYANRKKIILAIKDDVKVVFLDQIANKIIRFKTLEELYTKLEKI